MGRMLLGPLGGLREVESFPERKVSTERGGASFVTLGGRRVVQRSARAARSWEQSWRLVPPADVAYLAACADGSIPGPLYLHTQDAALSNLLPSDVAAPCRMGTVALGAVAGSVLVGMPGGVVPMSGVVQQASAGAWSAIIPIRQVSHVLSAWASAAGAAVEWRTVTAAGVQVATGTVSAAAVTGGFRGAVSIVPGATVAGAQVRLSSGSRTVGGLRLAEGVRPEDGVEVRRNLAWDPRATSSTIGATPQRVGWNTRWAGTGGTATATLVTGATDGPEVAPGVRVPTYLRRTWTVPTTDSSETGFNHTDGATSASTGSGSSSMGVIVVPGETWTISSHARSSVARTAAEGRVAIFVTWRDAAGTIVGQGGGATQALTGAWQRLSATVTVPAGAARMCLRTDIYGSAPWTVGATLDGTGLLVEQSPLLGAYFDGSTSPDPALLPSWTGTPNASPSVLKTIPADAVSDDWLPGVGVPQVVVSDPQQTLQLVTAGDVRSDYTVTIREVG